MQAWASALLPSPQFYLEPTWFQSLWIEFTCCFCQASPLVSCERPRTMRNAFLSQFGSVRTLPQAQRVWMGMGEREHTGSSFCCGQLWYLLGTGFFFFCKSWQQHSWFKRRELSRVGDTLLVDWLQGFKTAWSGRMRMGYRGQQTRIYNSALSWLWKIHSEPQFLYL